MLILEQFNKLILQQFRFVPSNLDGAKKTMFFIIEEAKKKSCLKLFTRKCKIIVNVLQNNLIFINIK